MSDRLHDHLTFGPRRGCVACAQVEADHSISARAYNATLPQSDRTAAHPDPGSVEPARPVGASARSGP